MCCFTPQFNKMLAYSYRDDHILRIDKISVAFKQYMLSKWHVSGLSTLGIFLV